MLESKVVPLQNRRYRHQDQFKRDSSCDDLTPSPARQKSARNSSGTSQIEASSCSATVEVDHSGEDDGDVTDTAIRADQRMALGSEHGTPLVVIDLNGSDSQVPFLDEHSPKANRALSPDPAASQFCHESGAQLVGNCDEESKQANENQETITDQSFNDENDSVGQEYSMQVSSPYYKVLPNNSTSDHMQNLLIQGNNYANAGPDMRAVRASQALTQPNPIKQPSSNRGLTKVTASGEINSSRGHQQQQQKQLQQDWDPQIQSESEAYIRAMQYSSSGQKKNLSGNRQKMRVRGSVVRSNFQQSLQAMNLPLRNQTKASKGMASANSGKQASINRPPIQSKQQSQPSRSLKSKFPPPTGTTGLQLALKGILSDQDEGSSGRKSHQIKQKAQSGRRGSTNRSIHTLLTSVCPKKTPGSIQLEYSQCLSPNVVPLAAEKPSIVDGKHGAEGSSWQQQQQNLQKQAISYRSKAASSISQTIGPKILSSADQRIVSSSEENNTQTNSVANFNQNVPEQEGLPSSPDPVYRQSMILSNQVGSGSFINTQTVALSSQLDVVRMNRLKMKTKFASMSETTNSFIEKNSFHCLRPKQPTVFGHDSSEEMNPEGLGKPEVEAIDDQQRASLSSIENLDLGSSPNIVTRQLQQLQSINSLSNQHALKGKQKFEEQRKLELKKLFQGTTKLLNNDCGEQISEHTFNQIYTQHQKTFSKPTGGPKSAIATNSRYYLDQNSQITDLKMPRINLKFVSLNLFSKNLLNIDLSENKIKTLPEEISLIVSLQNLQIEQNLLERLPRDIWKLSNLQKLVASQNQLKELPPNFEWLPNLETLQINDNLIARLPEKLGLLSNLKKLHVHENKLAALPRELSKLVNLIDFSLEWFMYTKPANSRIQKNPDVIKSIRDFCENFNFNPTGKQVSRLGLSGSEAAAVKRPHQLSMCHELEVSGKQAMNKNCNYVTFTDFIIQYHKIPHNDLSLVNKIEFTMKKRSLIHQLCFNTHTHLIRSLMNKPEAAAVVKPEVQRQLDFFGYATNQVKQSSYTMAQPLVLTPKSSEREIKGQRSSSNLHAHASGHSETTSTDGNLAEAMMAKVINLGKKDTQGVVPLCLLVMNMTPIERLKELKDKALEKQHQNLNSERKNFAKAAANFFAQDQNQAKQKAQNKKRKEIMRLLLQSHDDNGEPLVDINNSLKRRLGSGNARNTALIPQEQRVSQVSGSQQHPIIYWAVFKYQFKLAIELIKEYDADPTTLNSNNSNLLHILFANYKHDLKYAGKLAQLLIERKVNLNLVDKDGKSPLLVAIKKSQLEAIQFAHTHNIKKKQQLLSDPAYINASKLIKKNVCKLELFDFQMKGRVQVTPLHYAIKKSNYEAFLYLVTHRLCDYLHRNSDQATPRLTALINSAFYRILIKEEKWQIRSLIAMLELNALQDQPCLSSRVVPVRSLLGFQLTKPITLYSAQAAAVERKHMQLRMGPNAKAYDGASAMAGELALMKKSASELSVAQIYETNAGVPCQSTRHLQQESSMVFFAGADQTSAPANNSSTNKYYSQGKHQTLAAATAALRSTNQDFAANENNNNLQTNKSRSKLHLVTSSDRRDLAFGRNQTSDPGLADLSSLGSPRIALPMEFPIAQKQTLLSRHAIISSRKYLVIESANSERHKTEVLPFASGMNDMDQLLRKRSEAFQHVVESAEMQVEQQKLVDLEIEYDQLNNVCHYVFSRRSIDVFNEDVQVQIVESVEHESRFPAKAASIHMHQAAGTDAEQVKRPNRSSTLRLSDKDNFEFTLGGKRAKKLFQQDDALQDSGDKTKMRSMRQARVNSESNFLANSANYQHNLRGAIAMSPTIDNLACADGNDDDPGNEGFLFTNGCEDLTTTRVLQIDSHRNRHIGGNQPGGLVPSQKLKQFSMFRNIKNRSNLSPQLKEHGYEVAGAMKLYERRAQEMQRPPQQSRLFGIESPDKVLRRQESEISIPPSFRVQDESFTNAEETKKASNNQKNIMDLKRKLQKCSDLVIEPEDDFGEAMEEIELDEDFPEQIPNPASGGRRLLQGVGVFREQSNATESNLFTKAEIDEDFDTVRALEGPSRPSNFNRIDQDVPQSMRNIITSPHFNEEHLDQALMELQYEKEQQQAQIKQQQRQLFSSPSQRAEGSGKYDMPRRALSPTASSLGYVVSSGSNIERHSVTHPNARRVAREDQPKQTAESAQGSAPLRNSIIQTTHTETGNKSNIFISNMNININLNITVNHASDKSERKESLPETEQEQSVLGQQKSRAAGAQQLKDHTRRSSSQDHQLSTILDEEQLYELEHKPKPSTGSKTPTVFKDSLAADSEQTNMADQIKSSTLNSIIESQTKARILNQINPSEIVQAVSKHFQQNHPDSLLVSSAEPRAEPGCDGQIDYQLTRYIKLDQGSIECSCQKNCSYRQNSCHGLQLQDANFSEQNSRREAQAMGSAATLGKALLSADQQREVANETRQIGGLPWSTQQQQIDSYAVFEGKGEVVMPHKPLFSSCDVHGESMSASPPLDEMKMFQSHHASQANFNNLPVERKRFSPQRPGFSRLLQSQNRQRSSVLNNSCSENICTSVIGTTPSKPQFDQSAIKNKQNNRYQLSTHMQQVQGVSRLKGLGTGGPGEHEDCSSPELRAAAAAACSPAPEQDAQLPNFSDRPQNEQELFSGRIKNGQEVGSNEKMLDYRMRNPLATAMGDSTEKARRQSNNVLDYLLTENSKNQLQHGRQGAADRHEMKLSTVMSGSQDCYQISCTGPVVPNTYTLGNVRLDDQQMTLPSMTHQSNVVMQTGTSELATLSPSDPHNKINQTIQPRVNFANTQDLGSKLQGSLSRGQLMVESSTQVMNRQGDMESPLSPSSELIALCERQLSQNAYLTEFKIVCSKHVPDWKKYRVVYGKLAPELQVNGPTGKTATIEGSNRRDAMLVLELLIEVFSLEPNCLLADLVHLVSKSNMMRARNDVLDGISASLSQQAKKIEESKELLCTIDQDINVYRRHQFESQTAILDSFCFSTACHETANARIIHEVYKKIQLNKFPTISKNLGLFLKNKRQNEQSNANFVSREELRRTQNIPQSLQKRVKITMNERPPQMIEEPLNEIIFTPRDTMNSNRPQNIKPNPVQSVPHSHPTKLASQMALLNEVSNANKPGFHAKLQTRLAESVLSSSSSKHSSFFARRHVSEVEAYGMSSNGLLASKDMPSKIQPIRNIVSPKGFFPQNK